MFRLLNPLRRYLFLLLLAGCSSSDDVETKRLRQENLKGEYLYRYEGESSFSYSQPDVVNPGSYPWQEQYVGRYPRITKEFFRCKGSASNPNRSVQKDHEKLHFFDCGGAEKHSLPLRDNREFIYPVLIEILNFIQSETEKKVLITCGHRCPDHHQYIEASNKSLKHMIGAQVDFYVIGMENQAEVVVEIIKKFYKNNPRYKGKNDFEEFKRYEKGDVDTSIPPWLNKEIYIKIYKKQEGRDFDNNHSYPYISIQVRYDRDLNEKVNYDWNKAYRGYHRW